MSVRTHRAGPLAADDRRRAIVDAVVPLLVDRGASVTTREMAEAAGIAEGTIFRVFPDKCALIHEAVRVTLDPAPYLERLARIDHDATLEEQLLEATRTLLERSQAVVALLAVLHTLAPSVDRGRPRLAAPVRHRGSRGSERGAHRTLRTPPRPARRRARPGGGGAARAGPRQRAPCGGEVGAADRRGDRPAPGGRDQQGEGGSRTDADGASSARTSVHIQTGDRVRRSSCQFVGTIATLYLPTSTPTSSTTAWSPATPATSCGSA